MDFVQFLSAFGLGALVTALVQAWLTHRAYLRQRNFQEKKECYVGLLQAYHRAAVERGEEAAKNFGYWQMRCELVASVRVRQAIQEIVDTNDDVAGRSMAHEHLKDAIRRDLGVSN